MEPPAAGGLSGRVAEALSRPVDIASLAVFRIAFGAIMAWEVLRYFDYGWIERYWIQPDFFFGYLGFEWVRPWPGEGMYVHFAVLGVLAACIAAGLLYRVAAVLFFVGFAYVFLLDKANYLNHFYLIVLISLLLIVVPAHRAASVDARLRPSLRSATVPAWALLLLQFQIAIVYVYGGIAKLNGDWLAGEPLRTWLAERTDLALIGPLLDEPWAAPAFAYGGLLLDLLIVPLLLWRRTRVLAFLAAIGFHYLNTKLWSIGIFPWMMIAATTLFLAPNWPRRFGALVRGRPVPPPAAQPLAARPTGAPRRGAGRGRRRLAHVGAGLLALYVAIQVLVPLRHFVYPGNVSWTEEGHKFAWQMKLRTKDAADPLFDVTDSRTGEVFEVLPEDYLSERQLDKMATRPDMILQFAHILARELEREGVDRPQVRAWTEVSLNRRPWQPLVDPRVDLARVSRSLAPADWIVPLREGPGR